MITLVNREQEVFKLDGVIRNDGPENELCNKRLERNTYPATQLSARVIEHHCIEFNLGDAIKFSRKTREIWTTVTCHAGNIVSLMSPGESNEVQWSSVYRSLKIVFAPAYVDRVLEADAFKFQTLWNTQDTFLFEIATRLNDEVWKGEESQKIYCDTLYLAFVIHLASNYAASRKKVFSPKGKLSSHQLSNVIEFTRSSVHRNIRLSEMAACVHLSEYHFARLFRQTVGVSPYKFVLQMKIAHAQDLMRQHKKSFSDIAYMLNFSDQAHFSHVFKKVTGSSPRNFVTAVA
jgi:AraC family transcriptional regulator